MHRNTLIFSKQIYSFFLFIPLMIFFSAHLQESIFVSIILMAVLLIISITGFFFRKLVENKVKLLFYIYFYIYVISSLFIAKSLFILYSRAVLTNSFYWIYTLLSSPLLITIFYLIENGQPSKSFKDHFKLYMMVFKFISKVIVIMLSLSILREFLVQGAFVFYWQGNIYQLNIVQFFSSLVGLQVQYINNSFFKTSAGGLLLFSFFFLLFMRTKKNRLAKSMNEK